jgi:hypothetical protein
LARIFDEKKIYASYCETAPLQDFPEIFEGLKEFFVILKGNFVEDFFPSRYIRISKNDELMAAQDAAEAAAAIEKKKTKAKRAVGATSDQVASVAQAPPALATESTSATDRAARPEWSRQLLRQIKCSQPLLWWRQKMHLRQCASLQQNLRRKLQLRW